MRKTLIAAFLLGVGALVSASAQAAGPVTSTSVTLQTSDGVSLAGTYWGQKGKSPAV